MGINSYDDEVTITCTCPKCDHQFDADVTIAVKMNEPELEVGGVYEKE
jgi:hypothetical protein